MNKQNINYMQDKKLSFLKSKIKKFITYIFAQVTIITPWIIHKTFDLTHLQVFLEQPFLQLCMN